MPLILWSGGLETQKWQAREMGNRTITQAFVPEGLMFKHLYNSKHSKIGNGSRPFISPLPPPKCLPEMSVRMSNLDNERDERDEDSHEDRGISE